MRECVGLFLLYIAIAGGTIVLFGYDLTWQEKLGIFLGFTVFLGLIVVSAYLITGEGV